VNRLQQWLPWLADLRQPGVVRTDLMAGLTGAIVVLPQGLAFATLAGMPPQYGLYTAMLPCVVAALFGSSRLMVTGPANAISLTVLALLTPHATPESAQYVQLAITLTFMVGVMMLIIAAAGLGRLADRVPHAVIVGFTAGAAVLIINSQVRTMLGLDWPRGLSVPETLMRLWRDLHKVHLATLAVTLATVLACVLAQPFNRRVPYMLVGVLAGSAAAAVLSAAGISGADKIALVGALPSALPPLSAPDLSLDTLHTLAMACAVMTLLALAEALSIARSVAARSGAVLNGNREVFAQGLANLGGAFTSCYPASGSFNRSGVNVAAGASTPLAAISAALFLILMVSFVAPLSAWLPHAAVAGVLLMVALALIDRREILATARQGPAAWVSMSITFVMTVGVSLEWAIVSGIVSHTVLARRWPAQH
jgi:SulP family sulfate permease